MLALSVVDTGVRHQHFAAHSWDGAVAQLGERLVRNEEVRGSIPLSSTTISAIAIRHPNVVSSLLDPRAARDDIAAPLPARTPEAAMTVTTLSSRAFNQDVSRAKRAADAGPVIITDRGRPAYVLLRHETYARLAGSGPTIRELLDQPGVEDIDFDPPRLGDGLFRPADLG